ncbi:methionyl-tRNA formyltransferase [Amphibacillus indicireducens]|uniref:Methionyl-tRNA formyltransferase n=1 Tax=Amphibacillus indicireducens TaxID=1076330 RepID=A0ABP7VKI3_9BACI
MKKVIFCGFGKLGRDCMKAILENGYQIKYVMTHRENEVNSVDTFAQSAGIEYSYVDARKNLRDLTEQIKSISPDFLISVNYRYIIPKEIFTLADFALNIHGSLLPKYRGRTPHVWSIINGETESGITCHLIEESVDTGDIISQKVIPIELKDTGYSLLKKFESEYPTLLIDSIEKLINGSDLTKQDDKFASYYGKRTPDMGYIDFRKKASEVIDFVRAQAEPYPGAYYYLLDGRKIIINRIAIHEINDFNTEIGVIIEMDNRYYVRCEDQTLRIEDYRVID